MSRLRTWWAKWAPAPGYWLIPGAAVSLGLWCLILGLVS
jgi:hypothetical protein